MYKTIKFISIIIRQFFIPNPFEPLPGALIYNIIAEPIMHVVTFAVVGLFYTRGSEPAIGSLLYLMFYVVHTFLLLFIGCLGWSRITFGLVAGAYFTILILLKRALSNYFY